MDNENSRGREKMQDGKYEKYLSARETYDKTMVKEHKRNEVEKKRGSMQIKGAALKTEKLGN